MSSDLPNRVTLRARSTDERLPAAARAPGGLLRPDDHARPFLPVAQRDRKDLVTRGNRGHMGNPGAEPMVYDWIDNVLAGRP